MSRRNIALIAHDNLKQAMVEWVGTHLEKLQKMNVFATGTTGMRIEASHPLSVTRFKSGPLGGDQQIGAKIAEGAMDAVIFFWDPLSPHPHDVDVKALLRIAALYDIPMACNPSTAHLLIRSFQA